MDREIEEPLAIPLKPGSGDELNDVYIGVRTADDVAVYVAGPVGPSQRLEMPFDMVPDWGRFSYEAILLAAAMLQHEGLSPFKAGLLAPRFAGEDLAPITADGWIMPRGRVRRWLRERGVEVRS